MSSVLDNLFFNIKKGFHKKIKTPLKSTLSLAVTVMFSLKVSPSLPVRFKGGAAKKSTQFHWWMSVSGRLIKQ